ncbi:hypothetical protein J7643_03530 [bacterium]|nr:hypothetical protein [bacterium]
MPQDRCRHCQGDMHKTKRLTFPDGEVKLIYECRICERALVTSELATEDVHT